MKFFQSGIFFLLSMFYSIRESCSMSYQPATVIQAEGLEAQFFCQHPTDSGTIDWTIDGVRLRNIDTSDGSIRTEGQGAAVEALIIRALSRYNGTEIVCIIYVRENGSVHVQHSMPARLIVQGQLGAVKELYFEKDTLSNPSLIRLNWKQPFSLNLSTSEPDIVYCVDIFKLSDLQLSRDHLVSDCGVLETRYNFALTDPDPRTLMQVVVTPRSNVMGARNGTPTDRFLFEKPGSLSSKDIEVIPKVDGHDNVTVIVMINLRNTDDISGSRRPNAYEVAVYSVADNIASTCPVEILQVVENTTLILNCTDIIQPNQLFKISISGSNPAGQSTITQDVELSTHYVQDINTTNSTLTPGQVDISCEFIASNTTTLGYVALVYSKNEVHYLVTENSNLGVVRNHLEGLGGDTYLTLLYAINSSGLPLKQAAAFPENVTIIGSKPEGTHQEQTDDSVVATISHVNSRECLIVCSFMENSVATACVVVYWKNTTTPYGLVNFSAVKLEPQDGKAQGSINMGDGFYHVAVFAFSNDMISGKPIAKFYTGHETGSSRQQGVTAVAFVTAFIITVLALAVTAIITVAAVVYYCKRRRDSAKEESTDVTNKQPSDPQMA